MFVHELFENNEAHQAVQSAIIRRIMIQHKEALAAHGPMAVMQAAEEVADHVGNVEEIGTSDVSAWTREALELLKQMSSA